jgi:hypothetical protein
MVLDFEHQRGTLIFADGGSATTPLVETYDSRSGIRCVTYEKQRHVMVLDLVEGRRIEAEVGGRPVEESLAGRTVTYLDQNKWIMLAQHLHAPHKLQRPDHEAAAKIIDWARTGRIVLPLSGAHCTEIAPARRQFRETLIPLMLELCRGWQMRNPLRVRADELLTLFSARAAGKYLDTRPRRLDVFTLDPGMLFDDFPEIQPNLPPELADLYRRQLGITSLYSALLDEDAIDGTAAEQLSTRWATSFQDLAGELRNNQTARRLSRQVVFSRMLVDLRDDVTRAAQVSDLSPEQFETWLEQQGPDDLTSLPYLGTVFEAIHFRLRDAGDAWHSHDLNDLLYLGCASAYADYVVCEKKTAHYLTRVNRSRDSAATVLTKLTDLVRLVESA